MTMKPEIEAAAAAMTWPKVIYVCPRCERVQAPGRMGCTGAHEDAHRYERTLRIEVAPAGEPAQAAVDRALIDAGL